MLNKYNKKIKKITKKKLVIFREQLKIVWEMDVAYIRTATSFLLEAVAKIRQVVIPIRRHALNASLFSLVLVVGAYIFFPTVANADIYAGIELQDQETVERIIVSMQNVTRDYGRLPIAQNAEARHEFTIPITAYTSDPYQTDDTPCITASGLDVCERNIENVVAANFLPLGTRVRIPGLYGDRIFYVEDRMNKRYTYKMDIWMKDIDEARTFGLKYATIEVF